jgi:hypothetical protein
MKRHQWSDIKARTKPEMRARIDDEARDLSKELRLQRLTHSVRPSDAHE